MQSLIVIISSVGGAVEMPRKICVDHCCFFGKRTTSENEYITSFFFFWGGGTKTSFVGLANPGGEFPVTRAATGFVYDIRKKNPTMLSPAL
jgi:hypothetical protein